VPETNETDLTLEGLVHDLNNVFETILEASEYLSKDAKYSRLAGTIRRSAHRGSRIVSSFFEQSQASLDLDVILDEAIAFSSDVTYAAHVPKLAFVRNIEPALRLRGNPGAWERVFMNLFLNTAQAMANAESPEEGRVEINASRTPEAIEIVVADNGPGISAKVLPRIFEAGVSTRGKRSGLGLAIVRTLIERKGGTIAASNRPNALGAQFLIRLPHVSATGD
jgi:signal transduction histidine kinase